MDDCRGGFDSIHAKRRETALDRLINHARLAGKYAGYDTR